MITHGRLPRRARRHRHRRAARGRAHHRRDRAAAVHRAQQPVLEHRPERADGEPAGRHLPVRAEPLRGLAAARLDRRAASSRSRCWRSASSPAPLPQREIVMSDRTHSTAPSATDAGDRRGLPRRSRSATSTSSTAITGAEEHQRCRSTRARSPPSSARPAAASRRCCASSTACTTSIRTSAPTGEVLLDGENILSPAQDLNLLRAKVGMVFQKPTPFPMSIYDNIAFGIRLYEKLPKSRAGRPRRVRRCSAPRCGTRSRTSSTPAAWPVRRPAAAPVHRAHRRGASPR